MLLLACVLVPLKGSNYLSVLRLTELQSKSGCLGQRIGITKINVLKATCMNCHILAKIFHSIFS